MVRCFFLHENSTFSSADKRNMRDKAKGLRVTSERDIVGLSVRCLSRINSG